MSDDKKQWIREGEVAPATEIELAEGEVVIAPGQEGAFFPAQPDVVRWSDAEKNPDHKPVEVGVNAKCSCGWKADGSGNEGWTAHFLQATKG